MQNCWEQRHRRARQVTSIMRIRAKVQQLERLDFEGFCDNYQVWKTNVIPQCQADLKELLDTKRHYDEIKDSDLLDREPHHAFAGIS